MRKYLWLLAGLLTACTAAMTPTPVPSATPVPPEPTAPAEQPVDLTPFRAAMRPEFAAEIDRFGDAPQYTIEVIIAPDRASYTAAQQVRYTNLEETALSDIYFRLFPNTPSYGGDVTVNALKLNGRAVEAASELGGSALRVRLDAPLPPGGVAEFDLIYEARVPTSTVENGYNQFGLHDGVLTLPNFYPQIPAYDDEGWNVELAPGMGDAVFSDSALYDVSILAPQDQVIATSGSCATQPADAGQQRLRCVSGPMRDFMVAMSEQFKVVSTTVNGVTLNSYFDSRSEAAGKGGLQILADAVRSFTRRIGPYPFQEFDLLETPTTAGGIEYPGVIVIARELYEDNATFHESVIAHEAAHQWWYSLVGNDQVDEPWLDEGLTQFTTALYYLDVYGKNGFAAYVEQGLANRYDRVKNTDRDLRADLPVADYSDPQQYSALVYGKAPLFFNAVYEELGDAGFNAFLQAYFSAHRYGVAYKADLVAVLKAQLDPATVDQLLKDWIGPSE